ncbi:hypothetical protein [Haloarchaeobius sp. DYHT-AS-18]|uniref:hypothetical protein n=1 Tax=Haloarchaeobius sp. DYHT-AS-18 TaxID=3446117 RepID=UPI003EBD7BAE
MATDLTPQNPIFMQQRQTTLGLQCFEQPADHGNLDDDGNGAVVSREVADE